MPVYRYLVPFFLLHPSFVLFDSYCRAYKMESQDITPDLESLACLMRESIDIQDRRYMLTLYKSWFIYILKFEDICIDVFFL